MISEHVGETQQFHWLAQGSLCFKDADGSLCPAWLHKAMGCVLSVSRETRALLTPQIPPDAFQALGKLLEQRILVLTVLLGHAAFLWHSHVLPLTFTIPQHSAPAAAAGDNEEIGANSKK